MLTNAKRILKVFAFAAMIGSMYSCAAKAPYEITSPCVSSDSENPWHRSPCSRRPANSSWEIS